MPISPQKILEALAAKDRDTLNLMDAYVTQLLKANFVGEPFTFRQSLIDGLTCWRIWALGPLHTSRAFCS